MKKGGKEFRSSNYYDLLERCKKYPKRLLKIKKKVQMTFAILASGLGYNDVAEFCEYNDFPIMDESSFYDYLHFFDQILDNLVGKICSEKLEAALQKEKFIVGFDAGWAHRRNANQCIGIMIDLLTGLIVSFQIVHHGPENSINLTSTQQHSKSMEKIALKNFFE